MTDIQTKMAMRLVEMTEDLTGDCRFKSKEEADEYCAIHFGAEQGLEDTMFPEMVKEMIVMWETWRGV